MRLKLLVDGTKQQIHDSQLEENRAEFNARVLAALQENPDAEVLELEIGDLLKPAYKFDISLTIQESELLREAATLSLGAAQLDVNERVALEEVTDRLKEREDRLLQYPVGSQT
jgi:hypothetical protein